MDPVGEALWAKVLEDWDDDARHAAFIGHCQSRQDLGTAAARYRAVANDEPAYRAQGNRADDARKRLGGIATLAVLTLQANASSPEQAKRPARALAIVAAGLASLAAFVLVRACD